MSIKMLKKEDKKNKRGQLKIQEMAFVLLAVVFLFALIFLFFVQFQISMVSQQARMIREEGTIALLDYVAAMPEFGCSGLEEIVCVDIDKLKAFNGTDPENIRLRNNYEKLWEGAKVLRVSVEKMYPGSGEYLVYQSDEITFAEAAETYSTFIPVCEASFGSTLCEVGRIKITTEMPIK